MDDRNGTAPVTHQDNPARTREHALCDELETLSRRVRKRPVVVFLGRPDFRTTKNGQPVFSDNTKYLFLEAHLANPGFRVVWATFDSLLHAVLVTAGLPSFLLKPTDKATIDLLLHASAVVYSISPHEALRGVRHLLACLAGATAIQLWHGVSVKRLMLQLVPLTDMMSDKPRPFWVATSGANWFLSTAPFFDGYWREASGCRNLIRAGLPRNEVIFRKPTAHDLIGAALPASLESALAAGKPCVLLAPTWNRTGLSPLASRAFVDTVLQVTRDLGVGLALKFHPFHQLMGRSEFGPDDDVHIIDPDVDLYPHLKRFRALVTDYSSIMFDFLLTGRPVLTLEIQAGEGVDFEPDYSLVPSGDFRLNFRPETFHEVLSTALKDSRSAATRMVFAKSIFSTDPRQASSTLIRLLQAEVLRMAQPDVQVWPAEER
jgi:CDP-glycerol glycerophosphotransferase